MVGPAAPDGFTVWARVSGAFDVQLEYDTAGPFKAPRRTPIQTSRKDQDYIVVLRADGLTPSTPYYDPVLVDGSADRNIGPLGAFETHTLPAAASAFRVAFGSCARVEVFPEQPVWHAVQAARPDLFLWLGDIIYADALDTDPFAEGYRRQREVPSLQPVIRSVPQLAIWDDHDYGLNDRDRRNPSRDGSLEVLKRYWPNPSFGLPGTPGAFFHYAYGAIRAEPVEFDGDLVEPWRQQWKGRAAVGVRRADAHERRGQAAHRDGGSWHRAVGAVHRHDGQRGGVRSREHRARGEGADQQRGGAMGEEKETRVDVRGTSVKAWVPEVCTARE